MKLRPCSVPAFLSACPVTIVVAIIGYTYYCFVVLLCLPLFASQPYIAIPLLFIYHVLLLLEQCSYWRCVLEDPGGIPEDFTFDFEANIERSRRGAARRCAKCKKHKPDRAHHCSVCKRCVLKMDHHCPWVGNCVGFRNYKFFMLFLFYSVLLGLYVATCVGVSTIAWDWHNLGKNEIELIITGLLGLFFGLALVSFAGMHFKFVLQNVSTLEAMEKDYEYRAQARRTRRRTRNDADGESISEAEADAEALGNPFDMGMKENFSQVFGTQWWLWVLPVLTLSGDGTSYPRNREHIILASGGGESLVSDSPERLDMESLPDIEHGAVEPPQGSSDTDSSDDEAFV
eukprot:TRINITY_DN9946_c0_g1_i1.p1 TRINITY_DN9946_c0_g1~~TRINITY_DN9946_c0_g1_i1.p1  ORF type:complete len:390 (-),score=60.92 TRINITY_DN9946_c0_g1_i1:308-1339(-)